MVSAECCSVSGVMLGEVDVKESAAAGTSCVGDAVGVAHCRLLTLHYGGSKSLAASVSENESTGSDKASHCSDEDCTLVNEALCLWC